MAVKHHVYLLTFASSRDSRRDQEEGGELDSHEEVRHFAGPGEIKRREVVLDPQVSPEEIKRREGELGLKAGLFCCICFSTVDLRTLCL